MIRDIRGDHAGCGAHPFIEFADDNTFVDKAWGKELCRQLVPLRLKWFTETDISVADDPELLELMREAGCRQVLIGLESPAQRAAAGHRDCKSNFKARHGRRLPRRACAGSRRTASRSTAASSWVSTATRRRSSRRCWTFAREVPLYDVQITVLTAFPGRRSTIGCCASSGFSSRDGGTCARCST